MVLLNFSVFNSLFWHSRHRFGVWNPQYNPGWGLRKGESQFGHTAGALWGFGTPKRRGGHPFRAGNSKWESPIISLMSILKPGTGRDKLKLLFYNQRFKGWLSVLHSLPQKRSFQPNFDQFSAGKRKFFVSFVDIHTLSQPFGQGGITPPFSPALSTIFGTTSLQTKLLP